MNSAVAAKPESTSTTCTTDPASTTVGLNHSFVSDLVGRLTSPDGTTLTLFSDAGGTGHNFCRTVFADAGTRSIQATSASQSPFTGTWRPLQPLAGLVGKNADGTWKFTVVDDAAVDTGTLRKVSIHVTGFAPVAP